VTILSTMERTIIVILVSMLTSMPLIVVVENQNMYKYSLFG
jgi:hypothetical protein